METTFVLITCEAGTTDKVIKKLQMMDEIKETIPVLGAFDIITKVTAPTTDAIKDTIKQKIRTTDNIRTTMSLMVSESQT